MPSPYILEKIVWDRRMKVKKKQTGIEITSGKGGNTNKRVEEFPKQRG